MEIRFCHRHSEVIASARCFYCKKDICSECRFNLAHHFFCSYKCFYLFKIQEFKSKLKSHALRLLFIWGIGTGLLAAFLLYQHSSQEQEPPAVLEDSEPLHSGDFQPLDYGQFFSRLNSVITKKSADSAGEASNSGNNIYTLELPLKKGVIINVWQNGHPVISKIIDSAGIRQTIRLPLDFGLNRIDYLVLDPSREILLSDSREIEYRNPALEVLRRTILRGNPQNRRVSLTFDAGASNDGAVEILDILKNKNLKTTLFLTGQFIEKFPDLVRQMVADGHEIGNHTYDHPHLTTYESNRKHDLLEGVDREFVQMQLLKTDSLFVEVTGGHLSPYWRAPFGEYNQKILDWAAEAGYLHIRWTAGYDTYDWVNDEESPLYKKPQQVYASILQKDDKPSGLNGAIILMHLGNNRSANPVYEILPFLIDDLRSRGYDLTPITQLLKP